jgi:hypothetical protein
MEGLSKEELISIALSFKNRETEFPIPKIFIEEIKCGITFDRESSDDKMIRSFYSQYSVDEDILAMKLSHLLENRPAEFEKLYLAIEKFWEVDVTNLPERLDKLKLTEA